MWSIRRSCALMGTLRRSTIVVAAMVDTRAWSRLWGIAKKCFMMRCDNSKWHSSNNNQSTWLITTHRHNKHFWWVSQLFSTRSFICIITNISHLQYNHGFQSRHNNNLSFSLNFSYQCLCGRNLLQLKCVDKYLYLNLVWIRIYYKLDHVCRSSLV